MSDENVFDRWRARGEAVFNQVSEELMKNPNFVKAMQAATKGKEKVDVAVGQALKAMNVPTRSEFRRAVSRIDALERQVADESRGRARAEEREERVAPGDLSRRRPDAGGVVRKRIVEAKGDDLLHRGDVRQHVHERRHRRGELE